MVVTKKLAQALETSEIEVLKSRLTAIQAIEGNPMGVEIEQFGKATAFSVKYIPGPSFNTVKGLSNGDETFIEPILHFYKQKDIPVRFELTPGHVSSELLTYLSNKGLYHHDFHTTLYSELYPLSESENLSKITIRELKKDEFDLYAEMYTKGFGMPSFLIEGVAQNNQVLYNNENWTFFLASIEDEPAGIGVLFSRNGIGTLASATTLPEFRNQGIQTALIKQRMQTALEQGCRIIVGQAIFGSVSQNNMERAGMRIGYTKAIWKMN
ncbi:GNAT family N-acetyltransferase [Fredinandcohnia sp. QZ13]|uniref:GNAT family N-acetyltransferase n=1 Tax=Fredinandcohnia sp. QZ13 TaxID=3073144 RepID=UPI002852F47F|nr:GNAT family N-acetyltransferase [Fredinandcohnia sp. QZ13]MDR4889705.1 GNAT family N-acetyltransferase [Fredinandcohnia sp. QZ13]